MFTKTYLICYMYSSGTQTGVGSFYLSTKHKGEKLYNAALEAAKEYEPSAMLLSISKL